MSARLAISIPKLLIIDELGYLPLKLNTTHLLFQLVSGAMKWVPMLVTAMSSRSVATTIEKRRSGLLQRPATPGRD